MMRPADCGRGSGLFWLNENSDCGQPQQGGRFRISGGAVLLGRNPALRQLGLCWAAGRLAFYLNFLYYNDGYILYETENLVILDE